MNIINGNKIAEKILQEVGQARSLPRKPVLAMFLVGDDPSSEIYVCNKEKCCQRAGIESRKIVLPKETTEEQLITEIEKLNNDAAVDAMLVQLPLPEGIDEDRVLQSIDPGKDVDCLHPLNFGLFCEYGSEKARVVPVTALAALEILKECGAEIEGARATVVGNSNIVGKPSALLLAEKGATVTICHDKTKDLPSHTKDADILVVAVGKKHLIKKEMVKPGATIIDIGINREYGKIYGDVDFEKISRIAAHVTPVPGGVGPVTVAMLLRNTLELSTENQKSN